jgi:starch synthase (maltosyl-transferring)
LVGKESGVRGATAPPHGHAALWAVALPLSAGDSADHWAQAASGDSTASLPDSVGRGRAVIEHVTPVVDGGRFAVKREVGDDVVVEADAFPDGHDEIACTLAWRHEDESRWSSLPMTALGNDRWRGAFSPDRIGRYCYTVRAAVDPLSTWRRDVARKAAAGQDLAVEWLVGASLLEEVAGRADGRDRNALAALAGRLRRDGPARSDASWLLDEEDVFDMAVRHVDPALITTSPSFPVVVERTRARFGSWYELFPRSAAPAPGRHGTLRDVEARLPYLARLGFDVLYLPPIHPIGSAHRKGPDGAARAAAGDPGSPWAIGAPEGGHDAVHPELGTVADLEHLVSAAAGHGIEVALDIAFQCSPDHPWVREHPGWFRTLPDGSIRYAENPPKRYEDIYPLDFDSDDWRGLWEALAEVVMGWVRHGVRIFRIDNPHTKPLRFWEWLIATVRNEHPDVVFLSEAFTRPSVMYHLAKCGFSQSYTYFAWRTAKWELEEYFTELHNPPVLDFFRANLWPNTPDILTEELQTGGVAAFAARLVLAATLASSYGIYGPAFELQASLPRQPGSEEYLHSEKYEVRAWDTEDPASLAPLVAAVNAARRANPALQHDGNVRFHGVDNDQLIAFSRHRRPRTEGGAANTVVVVVNLDHRYPQTGWVDLDVEALGIDPQKPYGVRDLLTGARFTWAGRRNYVSLDPGRVPAHVLMVEPASEGRGPAAEPVS